MEKLLNTPRDFQYMKCADGRAVEAIYDRRRVEEKQGSKIMHDGKLEHYSLERNNL